MNRPSKAELSSDPPLGAATVPAAFQRLVAQHPDKPAMRTIDGEVRLTWRQVDQKVREIAAGLGAQGLGHGDTLAIVLPNTLECHVIDYAAAHLGAVPFAVYNSSPAVLRNEIEAAVLRANARLHGDEQIKKFRILPQAWLPDSEELTPTAKLKRRPILDKYASEIESMYAD